jgi:hypothetical protein
VTLRTVGALGAAGTVDTATDPDVVGRELPALFFAITVKVYETPDARPSKIKGDPPVGRLVVFFVTVAGLDVMS